MKIQSKKQLAYDYIREKILSGTYPNLHRLREEYLSAELGISRGPLREAISQLASEGLLEKSTGLGVYVKKNGKEELIELYEIREALESLAARKAATRISPDDIQELSTICKEMHEIALGFQATKAEENAKRQRSQWLKADLSFHEIILHSAHNSRLEKILSDFRVISQTFREKQNDPTLSDSRFYLSNLAWAWRDHMRILKAIQQRNPQATSFWMSLHIRRARKRLMLMY